MSITLFDVQAGFGGASRGKPEVASASELLAAMQQLNIAKSLVRMYPDEFDTDQQLSNALLYHGCAGHPELISCPVVLPAVGGDFALEEAQVDEHIRREAGAVVVRPGADSWLLTPWASGKLFQVLEKRKMPVICLERQVPMEQVAELAGRYPALPLIFAEVGYRQHRGLLSLLAAFPNIYLSIGNCFTAHKGIEQIVELYGAERLLFGSGYPLAEPMAAITQLMYAGINDEQRQLIGAGNLQRLIEGIVQ
ncbi:MAG: amidohydrolase family protein [Armatimonadota bacterium]